MLRLIRRNWLQIGALVAALAFVGLLATMGGCGRTPNSSTSSQVSTRTSSTGRASPSADAREAQVKAAAEAYVAAYSRAVDSGSVDELRTLMVHDSKAYDDIGSLRASVLDARNVNHVTTVITGTSIASDTVSLFATTAQATISYRLTAYRTSWPVPGTPGIPITRDQHDLLTFQHVSDRWLIESID